MTMTDLTRSERSIKVFINCCHVAISRSIFIFPYRLKIYQPYRLFLCIIDFSYYLSKYKSKHIHYNISFVFFLIWSSALLLVWFFLFFFFWTDWGSTVTYLCTVQARIFGSLEDWTCVWSGQLCLSYHDYILHNGTMPFWTCYFVCMLCWPVLKSIEYVIYNLWDHTN